MGYFYPPVGAIRAEDGSCTFTVWAPEKKSMGLITGSRTYKMMKDERGYWTISLPDIADGSEYFFLIDDKKKLPDPASRFQEKGVHGPSSVVSPVFKWTDQQWKGLKLAEMIIYELHVGTFSEAGTFDGVAQKLDYLKDLGVNTIEIMPVAQFPGHRNWGYDGVYPFAAQDSYGGVQGLKSLVNAAHAKGIAIILDVVYNHLGPEGNYLGEYGPYFTEKFRTNWGKAINLEDQWSDGVRNYFWQNAMMWLDEFHIDGLRLDAVHALWDFSARHFVEELAEKTEALKKRSGREKVLIAELDLNNPRYILPRENGGFGLNGQWVDEFHHALHSVVTDEVDGYYEDFGHISHLAKSLKDSYVYTGEYSIHRKRTFGRSAAAHPYHQFVVFAQNHDQIGNRMLGDRITHQLSFEGLKVVAATFLLSPHVPMLFMGEEYGEKNPFQYFVSHTDASLVELIRKGRKEEFSYFKWEGELPDPFDEKTFNDCKLSFSGEKDEQGGALLSFYKFLIAFRKQRPEMQNSSRDSVKVFPTNEQKVVAFERTNGEASLIIILNFEKVNIAFPLGADQYKKILDSSSDVWRGPGEAPVKATGNQWLVNAESVIILERKN